METTDIISALLTQKPESPPPTEGEIKCFSLEQKTSKAGKPWTKAKNSTPDRSGENYRILSVNQTDFVDAHGNISFNIELEKVPGNGTTAPGIPAPTSMDVRGPRIERQHSQHMAVLYAQLKGLKDIEPDKFRLLIDWFQKDIGHKPDEEPF